MTLSTVSVLLSDNSIFDVTHGHGHIAVNVGDDVVSSQFMTN